LVKLLAKNSSDADNMQANLRSLLNAKFTFLQRAPIALNAKMPLHSFYTTAARQAGENERFGGRLVFDLGQGFTLVLDKFERQQAPNTKKKGADTSISKKTSLFKRVKRFVSKKKQTGVEKQEVASKLDPEISLLFSKNNQTVIVKDNEDKIAFYEKSKDSYLSFTLHIPELLV
jgi:hypothetical protein